MSSRWSVSANIPVLLHPGPKVKKVFQHHILQKTKGLILIDPMAKGKEREKTKRILDLYLQRHFSKNKNQCTWGDFNNQKVTLCMKFNAGESKHTHCHYSRQRVRDQKNNTDQKKLKLGIKKKEIGIQKKKSARTLQK